jgi:CRP-like cAMP-binding protein
LVSRLKREAGSAVNSYPGKRYAPASLFFFVMSKNIQAYCNRKHTLTEKTKALAAASLAEKIGYLRIEDLPYTTIFEELPTESFSAHKIIRCKDELMLIKEGVVEVWQTQHDSLVKELSAGAIFGELSLLGQTMLGTKAIVGSGGAKVAVMYAEKAREWVKANALAIVERLGERLAAMEAQHYRRSFQLVDSRVAAALLECAGEGMRVEGVTHDELARKIGVYRETVTNVLDALKSERIIEVGRKRLTILNKRALVELSEL